jgi:hypothetical protein
MVKLQAKKALEVPLVTARGLSGINRKLGEHEWKTRTIENKAG